MLKRGIYKISWLIQVIFAKFLGGVVYLHNFRGKSRSPSTLYLLLSPVSSIFLISLILKINPMGDLSRELCLFKKLSIEKLSYFIKSRFHKRHWILPLCLLYPA